MTASQYSTTLHFLKGAHRSVLRDQKKLEKLMFRGAEKIEVGETMVLYRKNVELAINELIAMGFETICASDRGDLLCVRLQP